jgi:hypothetical protein
MPFAGFGFGQFLDFGSWQQHDVVGGIFQRFVFC